MDKKVKKVSCKASSQFTFKGKLYKVGDKIRVNDHEKKILTNFLI